MPEIYAWILVIVSFAIAAHAIHEHDKLKREDHQTMPVYDPSEPSVQRELRERTEKEAKRWFDHLNQFVGFALLLGAASAIESAYPAPYALTVLLLTMAASAYLYPTFPQTIERFLRGADVSPSEKAVYEKWYRTYFKSWRHLLSAFAIGYAATMGVIGYDFYFRAGPKAICLLNQCLTGCARDTDPVPIQDWNSVVSVFEAFLIRGEKDQFRKHSFVEGMPRTHREKAEAFMIAWRGIPQRMQLRNIEVIDWREFREGQRKKRELSSDNLVDHWMPKPDKIIIYHFQAGEEGKEGFAKAGWSAGVYQRCDGWRFSARWLEKDK